MIYDNFQSYAGIEPTACARGAGGLPGLEVAAAVGEGVVPAGGADLSGSGGCATFSLRGAREAAVPVGARRESGCLGQDLTAVSVGRWGLLSGTAAVVADRRTGHGVRVSLLFLGIGKKKGRSVFLMAWKEVVGCRQVRCHW